MVRTMLQHLHDRSTITNWGDGSVVRDFIYIDDVVSAIECVLVETDASGTFNVGSGVGHSINDLKILIEEVCGDRLFAHYEPSRSIDVRRIVLDSSGIKKRFNWAPNTSLSEGVAKTWKWLCTQKNPQNQLCAAPSARTRRGRANRPDAITHATTARLTRSTAVRLAN